MGAVQSADVLLLTLHKSSKYAYWPIFMIFLNARQKYFVNENLLAKYFVGLEHRAPDHSTLSVFREWFTKQGKTDIFEDLLAEIIQMAKQSRIAFGSI